MPESDAPKAQGKPGKKTKPGNKKLSLTILIVLMVLAGSTAGAYFYFNKPAGAATEVKNVSPARGTETESVDMGELVVNLNGNGGGHYLRVRITLAYPKGKKLSSEIKKKKPQLADTMITTLRSKTIAEVSPVSSIDGIKKNLLEEINKKLDSGVVTDIYFTDYLVQ